ncbi:MAG: site-2 protease family protein [Clostridia bacterium]|nr:site-2 protease family protein [Clostridia bacterium]
MISAIKIIFLLGFLVFIHELGHFVVAKLCKVKIKEFSIGFGPSIYTKKGSYTIYSLRLIPLGGYVNMLGEEEDVDDEGSFKRAKIWKRIIIVAAGGLVNIIFAIFVYFLLVYGTLKGLHSQGILQLSISAVGEFVSQIFNSLKLIFTGGVSIDQFVGPVGISEIIVSSTGISDYIYLFSAISLSLGITNLLPFPPLDGGRIILLLIEKIRKKPLSDSVEGKIQLLGFSLLILLSICVTYNDIIRLL